MMGVGAKRALGLYRSCAPRQSTGGVTTAESIERLLGAQNTLSNNRRLQAAMRSSRWPVVKTLDEFDFSFQPSIKRLACERVTRRPPIFDRGSTHRCRRRVNRREAATDHGKSIPRNQHWIDFLRGTTPTGNGEKQIGRAYGAPRQPSTLPGFLRFYHQEAA